MIRSFADYKPVFDVKINDIINTIMKYEEVQKTIIDYNQEQLQKGIDSKGQRIRTIAAEEQGNGQVYSLYTINMKAEKGQDYGNVTLYDTGEFYRSMHVKVNKTNNEVLADFDKPDGNIMDNFNTGMYDFLGLTDENLQGFATWIISDYLGLELKKQFGLS